MTQVYLTKESAHECWIVDDVCIVCHKGIERSKYPLPQSKLLNKPSKRDSQARAEETLIRRSTGLDD